MHINSPGGTTSGSEQLYDSLMRLKEKKPTVVVVDGLAASGGYIAALGADHIIAQETSLVGSIGVLFQYPNVTELLKTLGVKVEEIKSSPLKAAPNGFEPTSPEARAAIEAIVSDSYAWFRGLVKARRQLDDASLERVADGRVFTGRQAVALKLIDQLGDERTALAWLAKEKSIDPNTPVRDYRLRDRLSDLPFLHTAAVAVLEAVGLGRRWRGTSRSGARCRRSSASALTVFWPFGTLRLRTSRTGPIPSAGAVDGSTDDQIRACAAHLRAEPASLSARRGEHRQRHPRRDHRRDGARRPRRAARLRRVLGQAPAGPHRAQSAHRRARLGRQEVGAVLQDRQGNARAAQPPGLVSAVMATPSTVPDALAAQPGHNGESGTTMIRKIVTALILVPLAIVLVAFAVANRQTVVVSLDPFDQAHPALSVTLPLFALILALVIGGVLVGGVAAWLRQSKWRRAARLAEAEARELRAELDRLRRRSAPSPLPAEPMPGAYAPQLTIPPPAA